MAAPRGILSSVFRVRCSAGVSTSADDRRRQRPRGNLRLPRRGPRRLRTSVILPRYFKLASRTTKKNRVSFSYPTGHGRFRTCSVVSDVPSPRGLSGSLSPVLRLSPNAARAVATDSPLPVTPLETAAHQSPPVPSPFVLPAKMQKKNKTNHKYISTKITRNLCIMDFREND